MFQAQVSVIRNVIQRSSSYRVVIFKGCLVDSIQHFATKKQVREWLRDQAPTSVRIRREIYNNGCSYSQF